MSDQFIAVLTKPSKSLQFQLNLYSGRYQENSLEPMQILLKKYGIIQIPYSNLQYNIIRTQQMNIVNLQSQTLRVLFSMGNIQKNFTEINKLIQNVWRQPQMLNDSFRVFCNKVADLKKHNVDLPFLIAFYNDMMQNVTEFPDGFLPIYDEFFNAFPSNAELLNYVQEPTNYSKLRIFLIMIFCPILFGTEIGDSLFLKLMKLIQNLSAQHKQCLSFWLTDMEPQRFYLTVTFLQKNLSSQITKLLPDQFNKHDPIVVSERLMLFSQGLALFYRSNQLFPKFQSKIFENIDVIRCFTHGEQFNLHIRNIRLLNFIRYPFLLDFAYKSKLLEIQNHYQHQLTIQKGLLELLNNRSTNSQQQVIIDQSTIKKLHLQLKINRGNILQDSISQIMNTNLNLKNPLRISFIGEIGDDEGGIKKQYFHLLAKSIFNQKSNMFTQINNNSFYWFNRLSDENQTMFEFLGVVLGLSIYNNTLLDLKFPKVIYKKLIEKDNKKLDCLEELVGVDPDVHRSLKYILETEQPLDSLELTFEASVVNFGERVNFQLKPCGALIPVTQTNKHEYVNRLASWMINDSIEKQFEAFKKGFYSVVTSEMIKLFSSAELQKIICGCTEIDFSQLRKGARYGGGYLPTTPIIQHFWEIVHEFNEQQKRSFLTFTTGSDRIPVGGLSSLKFIVERHTSDSDMLPSSRTCSNLLLIPEYTSKQKLRKKLLIAIEHKQGFGLI